MESLQKLMPIFQEQLLQWYQFTLERPDYALALVVSVWLVMAIFYSIRIAFLKKDINRLVQANTNTQAALDTAHAHAQTLQNQINEINSQLQQVAETAKTEARRANSAEQRLTASNQQLADSLGNLVQTFELNLSSLPAANADNLVSEHQGVIARVTERFQNEQQAKTQLQLAMHAESAKLAEKDMLIGNLQHRLDTQTQQLAEMELSIERHEAARRQLETEREQLAQAKAMQQAEAARIAELEKRLAQKPVPPQITSVELPANRPSQIVAEPKVQVATPAPAAVIIEPKVELKVEAKPEVVETQAKRVEPAPIIETPAPASAPVVAPKKADVAEAVKSKGFWGKTMEKITKMDESFGAKSSVSVEKEQPTEAEKIQAAELQPVETVEPAKAIQSEEAVVEVSMPPEPAKGIGAKMGGLFGGFKKSPVEPAVSEQVAPQSESIVKEAINEVATVETVGEPAKAATKIPAQLTGLFGKFKSKK